MQNTYLDSGLLSDGAGFSRATHRRDDDGWITAALRDPATRFTLYWRGKALITQGEQPQAALTAHPGLHGMHVFIGELDGTVIFALDVSASEDVSTLTSPGQTEFMDLRAISTQLRTDHAVMLKTAKAMLFWRSTHKFCPHCGGENQAVRGGYVLHCELCEREHFPRTDPAVIMLVIKEDKILLGQSLKFPPERNFYSTLAGFVEPGETLEDAVRREVLEEVGVEIGAVRYHSSQPWPFPASLMLGFYAQAKTEAITLDTSEMRDAQWFTAADIANRKTLGFNLPPRDSIARLMIEDWLARSD